MDTTEAPSDHSCHLSSPPRKLRRLNACYATPPTSPDRFITPRRSTSSPSEAFRLSKSPDELSATERLLRRRPPNFDPFMDRRVTPTAIPENSMSTRPPSGASDGFAGTRGLAGHRAVSMGSVWGVGAVTSPSNPTAAVPDGRGGLLGSGTNAPMFSANFFDAETDDQGRVRFEGRLAAALDIDQCRRTLDYSPPRVRPRSSTEKYADPEFPTTWQHGQWVSSRVLDAPSLRDDYYCSVLAFDANTKTLAVGLNNRVYLWSEKDGVSYPDRPEDRVRHTYVTSLSFSSSKGQRSILATGRTNGKVGLWGLFESVERFYLQLSRPVSCLAFKPVPTRINLETPGLAAVFTEELLVADELGNVFYYSIEWTDSNNPGAGFGDANLIAKIDAHTQHVCGIAWSPDGEFFATGGNDNACHLFSVQDILNTPSSPRISSTLPLSMAGLAPTFIPNAPSHYTLGSLLSLSEPRPPPLPTANTGLPTPPPSPQHRRRPHPTLISGRIPVTISAASARHRWMHAAAVKALAFCPWQRALLATGGGSNDRAIRFFHLWSGACLATIHVFAQVTSLVWSRTRREVAATFGYAQPDHPYRIAVFSWPECRQVVAIPWTGEIRALYAIPYPGGPNEVVRRGERERGEGEGGRWWSRTAEEGCIVVASSDESVKFHEVWSGSRKGLGGGVGGLGWSDILEAEEGVEKEWGEVIR